MIQTNKKISALVKKSIPSVLKQLLVKYKIRPGARARSKQFTVADFRFKIAHLISDISSRLTDKLLNIEIL